MLPNLSLSPDALARLAHPLAPQPRCEPPVSRRRILAAGWFFYSAGFSPRNILMHAARIAVVAYVAVWFLVAGANMWLGVAKAGYSVGEELPIFLLIFAVPAVVAVVLKWKFI
jgi:hypothetical protein